MSLNKEQIVRIEEEAKKIITSRMETFPDETAKIRNAPFHEAFLECFKDRLKPLQLEVPYLVALASWLHGLNTSLGSGFENFAHILSGGYKRSFTNSFALKVKRSQAAQIEEIIRDLKGNKYQPDLSRENKLIFNISEQDAEINALDFTADNYIETDDRIEAIELKSVRPNSGEGRGEKQKILYGKAAFKLINPNKNVKFFVGFPFDPTSEHPLEYDKQRFFSYLIEFKKFFDPEEVLLGSELWDHLSGSVNTMEEVLDIIRNTVKNVHN